MSASPAVVNVPRGIFYFRDSPHYLYTLKRTALLEELVKYDYTFESKVEKILDSALMNSDGSDIVLGYGSQYGKEYGGVRITNSNSVSIRLPEKESGEQGVLDTFTAVAMKYVQKKLYPVQNLVQLTNDRKLEITFDSFDLSQTPNCFGLNETAYAGKEHRVRVKNQSPYNTNGTLKTVSPSQRYSVEFKVEGTRISRDRIAFLHTNNSVAELLIEEAQLLPYLKAGDDLYATVPNTILTVKTSLDLPLPGVADPLGIYYVIEDNAYYVVNADNEFVSFPSLQTKVERTVYLGKITTNANGDLYQGGYLFYTPEFWADSDALDSAYDNTRLYNYLIRLYDGIPKSASVFTNSVDIQVSDFVDNSLVVSTTSIDYRSSLMMNPLSGNYNLFMDNITPTNGATVTYLGYGRVVGNVVVPLEKFTKKYVLPEYVTGAPVVITDMLAKHTDDPEFTNVQFKIDGNELVFNRANNRIVNPTFLKESTSGEILAGWTTVGAVSLNREDVLQKAKLHGKSAELTSVGSAIRQFIRGVTAGPNYCLSLFMASDDMASRTTIKIYEFNNGGVEFQAMPDVNTATNVITSSPLGMDKDMSKFVARLYSDTTFMKDATTAFVMQNALQETTTDIVVEISKSNGTTPVFIDCVQFEESRNPTPFSHSYDYAIVEFEYGSKNYSSRFLVSPVDNPDNTGFLTLDITGVDIEDTGSINQACNIYHRKNVLKKYSSRPWAKLYGVNKFSRSSVFSRTRRQHKGEYFAYPVLPDVGFINFEATTLYAKQSILGEPVKNSPVNVMVQDSELNNLSDKVIAVSIGTTESTSTDTYNVMTDADGLARIDSKIIYTEQILPYFEFSKSPNASFRFHALDGSISFQPGEMGFLFNADGSYSQMKISSGGNENSLTNTSVDWDFGYTTGTFNYVMKLSNVVGAAGMFKTPQASPFDISLDEAGSGALGLVSGLRNSETSAVIRNLSSLPVKSLSLTKLPTQELFTVTSNSFNPLINSIKVTVTGRQDVPFRSASKTNRGFYYYVNTRDKTIYVSDPAVHAITVTFKLLPIRAIGRDFFFDRHIIMNYLKAITTSIVESGISGQNSITYNAGLASSFTGITSLTFPIFIKPYVNVDLYLKARYKHLESLAKITYTHRKSLL